MPRPELGTKWTCPTTGKKFYDLGKSPVVSPYSGEVIPSVVATAAASRRPVQAETSRDTPEDDEEEQGRPELVSLDEVEAEEAEKDTNDESDDTLDIDGDDDDGDPVQDDNLVVDEDDDDTSDLIDVDEENDED